MIKYLKVSLCYTNEMSYEIIILKQQGGLIYHFIVLTWYILQVNSGFNSYSADIMIHWKLFNFIQNIVYEYLSIEYVRDKTFDKSFS